MPSATDLFAQITAGVTGFISSLGQAFESVVELFWVTSGDSTGPTFLGMLILLGIGAGLIYLAFRIIRGTIARLRG